MVLVRFDTDRLMTDSLQDTNKDYSVNTYHFFETVEWIEVGQPLIYDQVLSLALEWRSPTERLACCNWALAIDILIKLTARDPRPGFGANGTAVVGHIMRHAKA